MLTPVSSNQIKIKTFLSIQLVFELGSRFLADYGP
jgi:hypothetical protein